MSLETALYADIDKEIADLDQQITPLVTRREALVQQKRILKAQEFIAVNAITLDDIELSRGDGKPRFNHVSEFMTWLRVHNCTKRFVEWNTVIYFTSDFLVNMMPRHMPATLHDIPGWIP